ncbi:hypothetical protein A5777_18545 [Gordonia sp. 852002-10350_SCH5691597]|nr:hypothetical protein A5777_18545 [Gordonia sp. 852002-10350_SCH5691597]
MRFAVANMQDAVLAEFARFRVAIEISGLQMTDLITAKSPCVRNFEPGCIAVGRPLTLAAARREPIDFIVSMIEKSLQFSATESPLTWIGLALLCVASRVPIVANLYWMSSEQINAEITPAILGRSDIVAEQP